MVRLSSAQHGLRRRSRHPRRSGAQAHVGGGLRNGGLPGRVRGRAERSRGGRIGRRGNHHACGDDNRPADERSHLRS